MSTPPLAGGAVILDFITGPKLFSISLRALQAQQTYLGEREEPGPLQPSIYSSVLSQGDLRCVLAFQQKLQLG